MNEHETPRPTEPLNVGEQNVERLLDQAYRPIQADADFVERLEARLCDVAREAARDRLAKAPPPRFRRLPWRLSWVAGIAAALLGLAVQDTQPIRQDDRGRHTTTRRELFVTPAGLWIDTPGMRELAQWIDDDEIRFDDIAQLALGFALGEPGAPAVPFMRLSS